MNWHNRNIIRFCKHHIILNIKEYIESGILEAYVLGELSAEESSEVEKLSLTYVEVAEEIDKIQSVSMKLIGLMTKEPPKGLLNKILEKINED